jgi:hypothetical protein
MLFVKKEAFRQLVYSNVSKTKTIPLREPPDLKVCGKRELSDANLKVL